MSNQSTEGARKNICIITFHTIISSLDQARFDLDSGRTFTNRTRHCQQNMIIYIFAHSVEYFLT